MSDALKRAIDAHERDKREYQRIIDQLTSERILVRRHVALVADWLIEQMTLSSPSSARRDRVAAWDAVFNSAGWLRTWASDVDPEEIDFVKLVFSVLQDLRYVHGQVKKALEERGGRAVRDLEVYTLRGRRDAFAFMHESIGKQILRLRQIEMLTGETHSLVSEEQ